MARAGPETSRKALQPTQGAGVARAASFVGGISLWNPEGKAARQPGRWLWSDPAGKLGLGFVAGR